MDINYVVGYTKDKEPQVRVSHPPSGCNLSQFADYISQNSLPVAQAVGQQSTNSGQSTTGTMNEINCILCTRSISLHKLFEDQITNGPSSVSLPVFGKQVAHFLDSINKDLRPADFCELCIRDINKWKNEDELHELIQPLHHLESAVRNLREKLNATIAGSVIGIATNYFKQIDTGAGVSRLKDSDEESQEFDVDSIEDPEWNPSSSENEQIESPRTGYQQFANLPGSQSVDKSKNSSKFKNRVRRQLKIKPLAGMAGEGANNLKCHICKKLLSGPSHLKNHLLIHTDEKPHECKICQKRFRYLPGLFVHKKRHEKDRPYKCTVCEKGFVTKWHMENHKQSHTALSDRQQNYLCQFCPKTYRNIASLNYHLRIHPEARDPSRTGGADKISKCTICSKEFKFPYVLRMHFSNMHDPDGKKFICDAPECGKRFSENSALVRHHKQVHEKKTTQKIHPCPDCDKTFRKPCELKNHAKKHGNELQTAIDSIMPPEASKVHPCPVCDKTFRKPVDLKRHARKHDVELQPASVPFKGEIRHEMVDPIPRKVHKQRKEDVQKDMPCISKLQKMRQRLNRIRQQRQNHQLKYLDSEEDLESTSMTRLFKKSGISRQIKIKIVPVGG